LTDDKLKSDERMHINKSLANNGYPRRFIRNYSETSTNKKKSANDDNEEPKGIAILPYVKETTERISRVLSRYKVKTCVKPYKTLRDSLSKPKDPIEKQQQTGVVYSIPCNECDTVYIGETKRALRTRQKEHQAAVRLNQPEKSALANHALSSGHNINWLETSILAKDTPEKVDGGMAHRETWTQYVI